MTNRLSILGKVNVDGGRVYGDFEKLGEFCGKERFQLAIVDCGLRILGGERYVRVAGFCGLAAGHRPAVRGKVDTGLENPVDPQTGKSALREWGLGGSRVEFKIVSAAAHRAALRGTRGNIEDKVDAHGGTSGAKMARCYRLVRRMHGWALPGPASEVLADGQDRGGRRPSGRVSTWRRTRGWGRRRGSDALPGRKICA
jgi:hypothetical protein